MVYGVVVDKIGIKGKEELLEIKLGELRYALADASNMKLATVNIHETDKRHSFRANFSAVHVIVPKEKEGKALLAAKKIRCNRRYHHGSSWNGLKGNVKLLQQAEQ